MAKHVFTSRMVYHAFNSQSVSHGRRSDGRVFFEGRTIYSYGRHYALAHIMPDGCALLNNYKHSVSTGQHISDTRAALSNRGRFYFPDLEDLLSRFTFDRVDSSDRKRMESFLADRYSRDKRNESRLFQDDTADYLLTLTGAKPGAWLPLKARLDRQHAAAIVKAFPLIKLCRERGQGWKRNGHTVRVGHFQIDEIDHAGNFKAGCHSIGWNEVERIARLLGVFEAAPADTSEATH